jgi:hypothetical protein
VIIEKTQLHYICKIDFERIFVESIFEIQNWEILLKNDILVQIKYTKYVSISLYPKTSLCLCPYCRIDVQNFVSSKSFIEKIHLEKVP